jgi:hypothetical protein
MYRIIDKRGTGKTSRLLLLAKENNGIVVCMSPDKLIRQANKYGITGLTFISYSEFIHRAKEISNEQVFIDDLECLMSYIVKINFSSELIGYTISED